MSTTETPATGDPQRAERLAEDTTTRISDYGEIGISFPSGHPLRHDDGFGGNWYHVPTTTLDDAIRINHAVAALIDPLGPRARWRR